MVIEEDERKGKIKMTVMLMIAWGHTITYLCPKFTLAPVKEAF